MKWIWGLWDLVVIGFFGALLVAFMLLRTLEGSFQALWAQHDKD